MATRRTFNFLPSVFQTDTNRKFLSATLDQLVSEPKFERLNGFIGRKFAPTYVTTDSYVTESDRDRQNYQLEPSVVIKNNKNEVNFYGNYIDLVNKISYYGGITSNHDRLFANEYYTFNGLFDQDKFVNYQQYFWLPDGPTPVHIRSEFVESQKTFTFTSDNNNDCLRVDDKSDENPEIVLSRGGYYKFVINQPGQKIYIQTEPGTLGFKTSLPNHSTREIYGVDNNGVDSGILELKIPLEDSQDVYLKMPYGPMVDYAIDATFSDINGKLWDEVSTYFDKVVSLPNEKTVIFIDSAEDDARWELADASVIPVELRRGVYKVRISLNEEYREVVNLEYFAEIITNNRIYVRLGERLSNKEFYLNSNNQFIQIPPLTAQLDILYYQDESSPNKYGRIRLVNNATDNINVDNSIIGKKNYTSPAGVIFSNGMVVSFDHSIQPSKYANKKFVIEGVGKSIRLVNFDNLVYPEPGVVIKEVEWDSSKFDSNKFGEVYQGSTVPEYIVMNRASLDLNAWARQNRWFHIDIINKSAELNGQIPMFNQAVRASRPIIEFYPDIQLFNNGRIGKDPVDHIDTTHTNAFKQVQNRSTLLANGVKFLKGQRILFANDNDPLVRRQVYVIQYNKQNQQSYQIDYDGQGTGTITIDPSTIPFLSKSSPVLEYFDENNNEYNWKWIVRGSKKLLSAIGITGLPNENVTQLSVREIEDFQFEITFITTSPITGFNPSKVSVIAPGGVVSVKGTNTKFIDELEDGTEIYNSQNEYLGTVSGVVKNDSFQFENKSTKPVKNAFFWYKKPRIQLVISTNPDDVLEEHDCLVATTGENKGKTFWYSDSKWKLAQLKDNINKPIKFDVFDNNQQSFSTYNQSNFSGTKIFSYKEGNGPKDPILGFPIFYTSNTSIADITFLNDYSNDLFQYTENSTAKTQKIDTGYLRQNINRYDFVKRNTWTTVNELSHQYQIISKTFTGETNYFEIDIEGKKPLQNPTIKIFLNNKLLNKSLYRPYVKINKRNTVLISANILTPGDKIDILILSDSVSQLGYYQIPYNLEYNSKNESFSNITLGQLRNNLGVIGQGLDNIIGSIPGNSNLRDLDTDKYNGNILQSSAPIIYSNLFLIDETANFVQSIEFARKEYSKFKNKFLELCTTLRGLDITNPVTGVDKILLNINIVKNKKFPWYYSDMVPYGESLNLTYPILDTDQRRFRIRAIFDDTKIQSRAVLVYLNNKLLIKDVDFHFEKDSPSIILSNSIILVDGDTIIIKDYPTTDGNYIPETPTKLGLYQKFVPQIFYDDTYRDPINVLQGHDGSLTPCFGDYRDSFLLELELRIFNNIKNDSLKKSFDVRSLIPGRFRQSEYSLSEYNSIINTNFLKWVGFNKINFSANTYFSSGDPFTYNYSQTKDSLFNDFLPGYWRGIYQYFYDTDKPHSHPWEMIGFTEKPLWWEEEYGPLPYTKDNALLWSDLELGIIRQGPRAGIDVHYARPGLSKIIPVDESGNLVPPMVHIANPLNTQTVSQSFSIGDAGPVESAWKRTSDFPFSLQIAAALMKPAIYFGTLIDTSRYYKDAPYDQYINNDTNSRISPTSIVINGETYNNSIRRSSGYINWITDYITSTGIDGPVKLRSMLDNLQVQLTYKVAGYVDKKYLTILAEQYSPSSTNESVIIPDDSYDIILNKSVPIDRISYSAVIIEKTSTGYSVTGYNQNNPYFIIVPSETAGDKYTITVGNSTAIIYKSYIKEKIVFPYGTEFNSKQQVVDFLVSYQRGLIAQGFIFNEYDSDLTETNDWILSVKEFLTWATQGWQSGSVIILSPVNNTISVLTDNSVVDQIVNTSYGSRLLDPNFNTIPTADVTVLRDSGEFKVTSITGKTIAFAELNLVQYEHVLVFDNNTIFNDVIYKPETGSRQFRLKLVGNKTGDWNGALDAPGFVYNNTSVNEWRSGKDYLKGDIVIFKKQYYVATQKIAAATQFDFNFWRQISSSDIKTGLLSNFANDAGKFTNFYNIDSGVLDSQILKMRSGLIGFRNRSYLADLNLNQTSQTKFYQGLIKNKGTSQSITNLKNAKFSELSNEIEYFEEWAVRVGEYGALSSNSTVEVILSNKFSNQNPLGINFNNKLEKGIVSVQPKDLFNKTFNNTSINFINRNDDFVSSTDIQHAGYVNLNDVNATLFDINEIQTLNDKIDEIISGYTVWIAKDYKKDWDVLRATESSSQIEKIEFNLDNVAKVYTKDPHSLNAQQIIAIKNFNADINGFYQILNVTNLREFTIQINEDQKKLLKKKPIISTGYLFSFTSIRFNSPSDLNKFTPRFGWRDNELVWIDNVGENKWAIIKKFNPWQYTTNLPIDLTVTEADVNYGTSVKIAGNYVIASAPGNKNSSGQIYVFNRQTLVQSYTVSPVLYEDSIKSLGHSIDFNNKLLIAGAPDSNGQRGAVAVHRFSDNIKSKLLPTQIISLNNNVGSLFGYSVSTSHDDKWLYVGAPGESKVYVFNLIETPIEYYSFAFDGFDFGCKIPQTLNDPRELEVYYSDTLYRLNIDYFVENNTVKFLNRPVSRDSSLRILITRRSYYILKDTISGEHNSEFGYSVKTNTDGDLLFVGAPGTSITITDTNNAVVNVFQAGKGYLYNNNLNTDQPTIVQSDNLFELTTPGYRSRFGSSIDFASDTKSVYFGSPGYSNFDYSGGAVSRYILINNTYTLAQEILRPINLLSENFGSFVKISKTEQTLAISSTRGTAKNIGIYDNKSLTFDSGATIFVDVTPGTGSVYMHEYMPGQIVNPIQIGKLSAKSSRVVNSSSVTYIKKNGVVINYNYTRGHTLAIFNEDNLALESIKTYDTYSQGSGILLLALQMMSENKIVVIVSYDATQLDLSTRNYLNSNFGTSLADTWDVNNNLKVAHTIISKKSSSHVAFEHIDKESASPAESPNIPQFRMRTNNGNFIFSSEFNAPNLKPHDQFGCSVDFDQHEMYIGASFNDMVGDNVGAVYLHTNTTGNPIWSIVNRQNSRVDPTSINSVSLYNKKSKTKITSLDYIDPVKGKLLGLVEQNLTYKTSRDPALYNAGLEFEEIKSIDLHWGKQQLGQTWWNLDTVRYIDYEQGDLIYRLNNWGKFFPGSSISVYEWIESNVPPDQYVANNNPGTPLHPDNSKFVQISFADATTGIIKTKYYFWVKGLTKISSMQSRTVSIAGIEDAILNPAGQRIPYAAVMSDSSIALFNCDKYINNNDVVLKIDYDNILNNNLIHSEFELIQEDNPGSIMPKRIINKLIDSLSGTDALARRVPDISLRADQMIGLEDRPRQTLVIHRLEALKSLARFSNSLFQSIIASNKLQNNKKISNVLWFEEQPKPTADHIAANIVELSYINLIPGEKILVESDERYNGLWTLHQVQPNKTVKLIANQSYRTRDLWSYKTWFKEGFNETIIPNYIIEEYKDIEKLVITPGTIVQVNKGSFGGIEMYMFNDATNNELIAVENGTLSINEGIFNTIEGGFDTQNFEGTFFDKDYSTETRNIINGLFNDIFIDDLVQYQNKLIFNVIRYILSEQKNVDWVFKTSFISITHKIKQLEQYPNYIRDNHNYYEDYINEVKPYKTKIRDYKISYTGTDTIKIALSDFDLPGYFDRELNLYRSPNGDYPTKDGVLFTKPEYIDWANHFSLEVDSILVNTGGVGYTNNTRIKIVSNGDAGEGASAIAVINPVTGAITNIIVTNPGKGYINTPYVFIIGVGTGASAYVQLSNKKVRSINTIIKFDRILYDTKVKEWKPNTVYNQSDLVSYKGKGYRTKFTHSSPVFNIGNFVIIKDSEFTSANDRVASTYEPGQSQIQKEIDSNGNIDLRRLIPGTTYNSNVVQSYQDVFNETNLEGPVAYDRFTGSGIDDINIQGGSFNDPSKHYAPEELVAGNMHDSLNICVSTIINNPFDANEQKIVKYRIQKDNNNKTTYVAIAKEHTTRLAKELKYDDTAIYLEDVSVIAVPNTILKIPGFLYINGEKIKFWRIDLQNNAILYPIRGVDGTGVPDTHLVGTQVEDQSPAYTIPNTTTVEWDYFEFSKEKPVFTPYFKVHPDIRVTGNNLQVFNSATLLKEGVDYTIEISIFSVVSITFTQAEFIKDGIKFEAWYTTDKIWLNSDLDLGSELVTDGTGLNGSVTPSAVFIKQFLHDLS